jgi:hypothetical protein
VPVQFNVKVTKEILRQSKYCGKDREGYKIGNNCAIALAVADIFPDVFVSGFHIYPLGVETPAVQDLRIPLPLVARQFIKLFDGFYLTPNLRTLLPEFEFEMEIPDEVIFSINIEELLPVIEGRKQKNQLFPAKSML